LHSRKLVVTETRIVRRHHFLQQIQIKKGFQDTKGIIRRRKEIGQESKQLSTKHYRENGRLSNMNPTKTQR